MSEGVDVVRRGVTAGKTPWVVLLLALGGPSVTVEAGPYLTHPLSTDAEGQGALATAPAPLASGMPASFPIAVERDGLITPTLNELGYPAGLPIASGAGAGVSEEVRRTLPAGRVASAGIARTVPARVAPLPAASDLAENPKRPVPEPASAILFVTGLIGLWARRRLLRDRGVRAPE